MRHIVLLTIMAVASLVSPPLQAETRHGCFSGRDAYGQPAWISLTAERYGDYYEVFGQISTTSDGIFLMKADGWSGAGRMFRRHEGEADALYIKITDYTGTSLVLHIEGLGRFPFQAVSC